MKSKPAADYILELSEEAEDDIRDIQQYTFDTYGEQQVFIYKTKLDDALKTILHNPRLGHKRSDIPSEYDAYLAGEHIIVFRVEKKIIYVVRVLHGHMDFSSIFNRGEYL